MKRDGHNESLWQSALSFTPGSALKTRALYDVIIVGGGMTGITTAYMLQDQGKNCLLLEARNLGFGTTGGTTAHLNTLLDTPYLTITKKFGIEASKTVAAAASQAIRFIEDQVKVLDIDCAFVRTDAYLFSQNEDESNQLSEILQASEEAGLSAGFTTDIPIPVAFERAARFDDQAKFHPLLYLSRIAAGYERLGGHIIEDCRVTDVKDENGELVISSTRGQFNSNKVVYATHIPPGVNILHLRCAPWRSYAMAVKLANNRYPEGLVYDMKDPYHYYRTQKIGDESYLIAGGNDHKTGEVENTDQQFTSLRAHVGRIFDVAEISYQWSSQYFESADGLPYIGLLPGENENYYVATGFGGNGMIYSQVAAREISHHIMTGESYYKDLFSPSRVKPIAGFSNFVSHNADVVKHFVGKWFGVEHIEQFAELAPGEGKVVTMDKTPIAVYKDDNGKLHAVSPVCTHMKCNVAWNSTERTWDCPCHGARYSVDGKVLTGPADKDLEVIELKSLLNEPA